MGVSLRGWERLFSLRIFRSTQRHHFQRFPKASLLNTKNAGFSIFTCFSAFSRVEIAGNRAMARKFPALLESLAESFVDSFAGTKNGNESGRIILVIIVAVSKEYHESRIFSCLIGLRSVPNLFFIYLQNNKLTKPWKNRLFQNVVRFPWIHPELLCVSIDFCVTGAP